MNHQSGLIAKGVKVAGSKGKLALRLGMQHPTLNQVIAGKRHLTDRQAWTLAEVIGQPITDVMALVNADRAKTPEDQEFWSKRIPRVMATAAIWTVSAVVAVTLGISSHNVYRGQKAV